MKKIKILLTAVAVMGIVGGALAFKAKKAFGVKYCITTLSPTTQGGFCDVLISRTTVVRPISTKYFTTNPVNGLCTPGVVNCPVTTLYVE